MGITLGILEERMEDDAPATVTRSSEDDGEDNEVAAKLDQLLFHASADTQPLRSTERDEDELVTLTAPVKPAATDGSASMGAAARALRAMGFVPVGDVSVADETLGPRTGETVPVPTATERVLVQEVGADEEVLNKS